MRVLHLNDEMDHGGLQTVLVSLCRALVDREVTVGVMAASGGPQWANLPPEVRRFPTSSLRTTVGRLRLLAALRRSVRTHSWHVVHVHQRGVALCARVALLGTGVPVVEHVHNSFRAGWVARLLSFRGHHLIACGSAVGRMLERDFGRRPDRITIVENGVDDLGRDRDLTLPCTDRPVPKIVGIGRLHEQKDPLRFVEIIRQLNRDDLVVEAEWVGDGPLRSAVEADLEADPVRGLHLAGQSNDVPGRLVDADLLLLTSRWEGLPLVALEASSLGRGLVLPAVGSCADVAVPDVNGLLLPPDEPPAATAARLRAVLNAETLAAWGKASRDQYLQASTTSQMTDEVIGIYALVRRLPPEAW